MIFRIVGRFNHGFCSAVWTADERVPVVWLCDCLGLRVDFVRGLEQGLSYRSHCQLGVDFGQSKISCAMKAKKTLPQKTFQGAEALLDAETTLRDQLVEALFRSPQRAPRTALRMIPSR
jgi:hypothetical protein